MALNPIYPYNIAIVGCMASFDPWQSWELSNPLIRSDLRAKQDHTTLYASSFIVSFIASWYWFFSVLKRVYSKEIEPDIRAGVNSITKLDFLNAYLITRAQSYKAETIENSFVAVGLVLFNPERVIETLNIQLKTPTPLGSRPLSRGSEYSLKTP